MPLYIFIELGSAYQYWFPHFNFIYLAFNYLKQDHEYIPHFQLSIKISQRINYERNIFYLCRSKSQVRAKNVMRSVKWSQYRICGYSSFVYIVQCKKCVRKKNVFIVIKTVHLFSTGDGTDNEKLLPFFFLAVYFISSKGENERERAAKKCRYR